MGFKVTLSVFFILFRTSKCFIEKSDIEKSDEGGGAFEKCGTHAKAGSFTCIYMIGCWSLYIIHASIPQTLRKDLKITMYRIASMNLSLRQFIEGFLMAFTIFCGLFLFAMMTAYKPSHVAVDYIGMFGTFTMICT